MIIEQYKTKQNNQKHDNRLRCIRKWHLFFEKSNRLANIRHNLRRFYTETLNIVAKKTKVPLCIHVFSRCLAKMSATAWVTIAEQG